MHRLAGAAASVPGSRLNRWLSEGVWGMGRRKSEVENRLGLVVGERGSYFPLLKLGDCQKVSELECAAELEIMESCNVISPVARRRVVDVPRSVLLASVRLIEIHAGLKIDLNHYKLTHKNEFFLSSFRQA